MKKVVSLLLVLVFVLAFGSVALAMSENSLKGHDASPAFEVGSHDNQRVHVGNGPVFNQPAGVMCIPTATAGENSDQLRPAGAFDDMSVLIPGN